MMRLLDLAIETVRGLPASVQDDVASALLRLVGAEDEPKVGLSSEDRAALMAADAEIARGDVASEAEMQALWAKPIP